MYSRSKEAMRAGARKGQKKRAEAMRRSRYVQVRRALVEAYTASVADLSKATGRSEAVVRAALKEIDGVKKVGKKYYLPLKGDDPSP